MAIRDPGGAYLKAVGRAIRAAREAKEVSQEILALRIEVDRTYISGVERGVRNPSVRVLRRIAEGLGIAPSDLLRAAEKQD